MGLVIAIDGHITYWGIYDTQERCWIGDEVGPKRYDNITVASIAAPVLEMKLHGKVVGRFETHLIPADGFRFKDNVESQMDTLTALNRVENSGGGGRIIEIDMKELYAKGQKS